MKKINKDLLILFLNLTITISGFSQTKDDYLIKVFKGKYDELGVESGYRNLKGDTVIPIGKYYYCYTDTLKNFAIVMTKKGTMMGTMIGIDRNEKELFKVYPDGWFPDIEAEGYFRIIEDNKIGYADSTGKISIKPQFDCAYPFKKGVAQVSYSCTKTIFDKEYDAHEIWDSDSWFYIDKKGNKVQLPKTK